VDGLRVFGIDRSADMLEACKQKGFATELQQQHGLKSLKWVGFSVFMNPDGTEPLDMKAYLARRIEGI
jgi:hypothetical protein